MTVEKMVAGQRVPRNLLISETLRDGGAQQDRPVDAEDYLRLTLRRASARTPHPNRASSPA